MFTRFKELAFKLGALGLTLALAVLIVAVLVSILTHTSAQALAASLTSREIWFAVRLSLVTSIISTLICILISLPSAYVLARYNFRSKSILNTLLNVPLALPPLVAGLGLLILFGTTSFGKGLESIGIEFVFTPAGIVLAQFFVNVPFTFRVLRSTFQNINPRYEYVAQTLGYSEAGTFRRVTLPMAKNGLMAALVITWCRGIGEFGAVLMLAGATRFQTETLPISLYLNMLTGDLPMAIAAAAILIVISLVMLFFFERFGGYSRVF
jgi:molybdate transport system permease protein